MINYTYYV